MVTIMFQQNINVHKLNILITCAAKWRVTSLLLMKAQDGGQPFIPEAFNSEYFSEVLQSK